MLGPRNLSLFTYQAEDRLDTLIPQIFRNWYPTPYLLVKELLASCTEYGDLVWDPACGMGTTGLAGLEMKRRVISSDISPAAVCFTRLLLNYCDFHNVQEEEQKLKLAYQRQKQLLYLFSDDRLACKLPYVNEYIPVNKRGIRDIASLYSPGTGELIAFLDREINNISDNNTRMIMQGILLLGLYRWSKLSYDFHKDRYYPVAAECNCEKGYSSFSSLLYQILDYKNWVLEISARRGNWLPQIYQQSFCQPLPGKNSLDYILIHWPEEGFSSRNHFYLEETFLGERTDGELIVSFDLPGKLELKEIARDFMRNAYHLLKPGKKLSIICQPTLPLISILFQAGIDAGFAASREDVRLRAIPGEGKKYFVITLTRKRKNQIVMGSLHKMKIENLYDSEAVLIRQIRQLLMKRGGATAEEIKDFLLTQHLYSIQIEKPLQEILQSSFIQIGEVWINRREGREQAVEDYLLDRVRQIIIEITYLLLRERQNHLTFSGLSRFLDRVTPRFIYSTGYYHPLERARELKGYRNIGQVIKNILDRAARQREDAERTLMRIVQGSPLFRIIEGDYLLLNEWGSDKLFPIFLEILERRQEERQEEAIRDIAEQALQILPEVSLDERSSLRLERYLEGLLS
ncbi:MAG: DNA methyltransferase [Halanaerobium sp.]|nr:DNA methyltransferase [Halanaerobium sp.]